MALGHTFVILNGGFGVKACPERSEWNPYGYPQA